jgi:hypothetical protein
MVQGSFGSSQEGWNRLYNKKEYYNTYYHLNKKRIKLQRKKRYDADPEKYKLEAQQYRLNRKLKQEQLKPISPTSNIFKPRENILTYI